MANVLTKPCSNPGDKAANDTVTSFAYLLADRYSKTVRATRSWESGPNDFLVGDVRTRYFDPLNN